MELQQMKTRGHTRIHACAIGLAATALLMLPHTASAQCLPDPVADGGTVTCVAVDGDGFTTGALGITFDHTAGGQIVGNVALGAGPDNYVQSGATTAVNGTVHTGAGNDIISLAGGSNTDSIDAEEGMDTITLNGASLDRLHGGDDADEINLLGGFVQGGTLGSGDDLLILDGATVGQGFDGGDGVDTINLLSGSAFGFGGNNGNDVLLLDGATITTLGGEAAGFYPGETGDDNIRLLSGQADFVLGDEGNDTIILDGATVTQTIAGDTIDLGFFVPASLGSGADNIQLLSGVAEVVLGGAGNDSILVDGATVNSNLEGDAGEDVIDLLSGTAYSNNGGDDNDIITLDGATVDGIGGDAGDDQIYLLSGSFFDIDSGGSAGAGGGTGNDLLVLNGLVTPATGVVDGGISGGDDDDTLQLLAGQIFAAGGGNGDDTINLNGATVRLVLGETSMFIPGETGNDQMNLLAGNADFVAGDLGNDLIILDGANIADTIAGDVIDVGFGPPADPGAGDDEVRWLAGTVTTIDGGNGSDDVSVSAASYDGTQLLDGGDDNSVGDGWTDELVLQGFSLSLTGANLANWENIVLDGSTLLFTDGALSVAADVGAGLRMQNGGALTLEDGATGDVFTLTGNLLGGGEVILDVELGDSSSARDAIVVDGDVSGTTTLRMINRGGLGNATSLDGILVAQVNGTSSPGAFALPGGALRAGDFVYSLVQVGNNWYLQSEFELAPAPAAGKPIPALPPLMFFFTILLLVLIANRASTQMAKGHAGAQ